MNVQELRIGNVLKDREGRLCKVEGISIDELKCYAVKGATTSLPFSGIPLTEDILVKLGFEGDEDERHIVLGLGSGEELSIELLSNTSCVTRSDPKKLGRDDYVYLKYPEYLHQLQNLYFALTGTELNTDKLFER